MSKLFLKRIVSTRNPLTYSVCVCVCVCVCVVCTCNTILCKHLSIQYAVTEDLFLSFPLVYVPLFVQQAMLSGVCQLRESIPLLPEGVYLCHLTPRKRRGVPPRKRGREVCRCERRVLNSSRREERSTHQRKPHKLPRMGYH